MANYNAYSRSNYFKTPEPQKLKALVEKIGAELWEEDIDGERHYAFGAYGSLLDYYDEEMDEMVDVAPKLQELVEKNDVIIIQEAGHEELRYVVGFAVVITKDEINTLDLQGWAIQTALEMVCDDSKDIRMIY